MAPPTSERIDGSFCASVWIACSSAGERKAGTGPRWRLSCGRGGAAHKHEEPAQFGLELLPIAKLRPREDHLEEPGRGSPSTWVARAAAKTLRAPAGGPQVRPSRGGGPRRLPRPHTRRREVCARRRRARDCSRGRSRIPAQGVRHKVREKGIRLVRTTRPRCSGRQAVTSSSRRSCSSRAP